MLFAELMTASSVFVGSNNGQDPENVTGVAAKSGMHLQGISRVKSVDMEYIPLVTGRRLCDAADGLPLPGLLR